MRKTPLLIVALLMLTAMAAATAVAAVKVKPGQRVVVARLSGLGVDPEIMKRLEDYLRGEISRIPGFSVVKRSRQEKVLASPSKSDWDDCRGDPRRMRRLAHAFKARYAVQGTVASFGGKIQFNVKVLNVKAGKKPALREESGNFEGSGDKIIPGIRLIAYRLFAPRLITGYLKIDVPLEGVKVLVDGTSAGVTPFNKPLPVQPGKHKVIMRREGFKEMAVDVITYPFQITVVNATPVQPE